MKLVSWTTALVIMLAFNTSIGASDQTQFEMNQEACGKYKKADAELNRIYQQVLRDYAEEPLFSSVRYGTLIAGNYNERFISLQT